MPAATDFSCGSSWAMYELAEAWVANPATQSSDSPAMTNPSFGANTHLDLVRTMSMSTDKEVLRQLRDAMNPKQKQQTRVMLAQMTL